VHAPCSFGNTALSHAALSGHTEIVKILVDAKADVDVQDSSGYTALMHVIEKDGQDNVLQGVAGCKVQCRST